MCQICQLVLASYEMARAESPHTFQATLDGQLPDRGGRPTPEGSQQNGHHFCQQNSTCTYYITINKCILITANKPIHIMINDKRMRLLTSLYSIVQWWCFFIMGMRWR